MNNEVELTLENIFNDGIKVSKDMTVDEFEEQYPIALLLINVYTNNYNKLPLFRVYAFDKDTAIVLWRSAGNQYSVSFTDFQLLKRMKEESYFTYLFEGV